MPLLVSRVARNLALVLMVSAFGCGKSAPTLVPTPPASEVGPEIAPHPRMVADPGGVGMK